MLWEPPGLHHLTTESHREPRNVGDPFLHRARNDPHLYTLADTPQQSQNLLDLRLWGPSLGVTLSAQCRRCPLRSGPWQPLIQPIQSTISQGAVIQHESKTLFARPTSKQPPPRPKSPCFQQGMSLPLITKTMLSVGSYEKALYRNSFS